MISAELRKPTAAAGTLNSSSSSHRFCRGGGGSGGAAEARSGGTGPWKAPHSRGAPSGPRAGPTPLSRPCSSCAASDARLLPEQRMFVSVELLGAVHHEGHTLDTWLQARRLPAVPGDRPRHAPLQLVVDLPDALVAVLDVCFH